MLLRALTSSDSPSCSFVIKSCSGEPRLTMLKMGTGSNAVTVVIGLVDLCLKFIHPLFGGAFQSCAFLKNYRASLRLSLQFCNSLRSRSAAISLNCEPSRALGSILIFCGYFEFGVLARGNYSFHLSLPSSVSHCCDVAIVGSDLNFCRFLLNLVT